MKRFILISLGISLLFVSCATAPEKKEEVKEDKKIVLIKEAPKEPEDWAKYYTQLGLEALEVKDGKVDFDKLEPLILGQITLEYRSLGQKIGQAWKIGKE